ncbi:hypothetical protein ACWCRF_17920 [Streptomyces sp. NPDC002405]|uniref:hypothetical protein n=1 Tax=Streptomyces sp. NPDC057596 TaxID=3346178 RepID=UPI0036C9DDB7
MVVRLVLPRLVGLGAQLGVHGAGHYIAEADLTADPSRARRSFTPADWQRLRSLRAEYDPQGLFFSYLSA